MTFTIIEPNGNTNTVDIETIDEFMELADKYGWITFSVNMRDMTITVEMP